jgi:phosphatidate cytidylyltransferase
VTPTRDERVSPGAPSKMRDLAPRLASGVIMAIAAVATLWKGGDWFNLFWLCAALIIHWEWQTLIRAPAYPGRLVVGWIAIIAAAWFARKMAPDLAVLWLAFAALALAWIGGPGKRTWSGAGVIYAGALAVAVIALRISLNGAEAIAWLFAVVWGTDVMAYFGGRGIGGPKLWPRVSPSKTWSGFLVGVSCGAAAGVLALVMTGALSKGSLLGVFITGLVAAIVSQGGDLFESSIKRHFGVKDSSHLIPGHGGFMDRLDGFIAAAVFAAIVGGLRNGPVELAIGVLRW